MKKSLFFVFGIVILLSGCDKIIAHSENNKAVASPIIQNKKVATENLPTMDNANTSLDWNGTYIGTLPCASCEGIKTTLTINTNGSFQLNELYLGAGDDIFSEGTFTWNKAGNTIMLHGIDISNQYFVGENVLMMLDSEGKRIRGSLASSYNLIKQ